MFMWRSGPESRSFTRLVSQGPRTDHEQPPRSRPETRPRRAAAGIAGGDPGERRARNRCERPARSRGRRRRALAAFLHPQRPKRAEFGDYSTNAALLLAPEVGAPPRELAERLGGSLAELLGESLERFEVAGPGFLNLFLSDGWFRQALAGALAAGERYGAGGASPPPPILVEFVSANPTGPMHVGHARNAAYGDSLSRMLAFYRHQVSREFYVNDAGSQIAKFGESIRSLARGEAVPDDGYKGDYVAELVGRLPGAAEMEPAELGRAAVGVMIDRMRDSLACFTVEEFDHWQYESALHEGAPGL